MEAIQTGDGSIAEGVGAEIHSLDWHRAKRSLGAQAVENSFVHLSPLDPVNREPADPEKLAEGQQVVEISYQRMGHMGG